MAIHEECGVFGNCDPEGDCARSACYGLYALQHRGQEACGICDGCFTGKYPIEL